MKPDGRGMPEGGGDMTSAEALAFALQQRAEAQDRWRTISPLVASLRRIREEDALAERFRLAFRDA